MRALNAHTTALACYKNRHRNSVPAGHSRPHYSVPVGCIRRSLVRVGRSRLRCKVQPVDCRPGKKAMVSEPGAKAPVSEPRNAGCSGLSSSHVLRPKNSRAVSFQPEDAGCSPEAAKQKAQA